VTELAERGAEARYRGPRVDRSIRGRAEAAHHGR
jgi:hypothetical protein